MRVVATARGLARDGVKDPGDVFPCPRNAKGDEIVKSGWYVEYKEGETSRKPADKPVDSADRGNKNNRHGVKSLVE